MLDNVDDVFARGLTVEVGLARGAEGDLALFDCKNSVVFAQGYVFAREHAGAALADNDVALVGYLAGIELDAQIFGL